MKHSSAAIMVLGCALLIMIPLFSNGSCLAEEPLQTTLVSVKDTFQSEYLTLHLDAAVHAPNVDEAVEIFQSTFAVIDPDRFKAFIFGNDAEVIDEWNAMTPLQKKQSRMRFPEHELYYGAQVNGHDISTRYDVHNCALSIRFDHADYLLNWYEAEIVPESTLSTQMEESNHYIKGLADLGLDDLTFQNVYLIPQSKIFDDPAYRNPFYIAVYSRMLNHIPVAVDTIRWHIPGITPIYGPDEMLIMMDEDGVFRIAGHYREYKAIATERIRISLADALIILKENMDYAPIRNQTESTISEIEFCYRLSPVVSPDSLDYNIIVEARPAWRFASKTNRNMESEFIMFIDAITGEVLR